MNENERSEKLNDYVDGVLSAEDARNVEAELERDPMFREEEKALRDILSQAARLPKSVVPKRDLWPDIESCLGARAPRSRFAANTMYAKIYRASLAAAAAIVIFIAGVWYARNEQPIVHAPSNLNANSATIPNNNSQQVELASYQQIEKEYAGVRTSLREAVDKIRPDLAPETVKVVDESLATIDTAIKELESALATDPGNHGLIRSLVAAYDQEVGLLRNVSRISERPGENEA